jgi:intracellular sulfur oxidation DsrE/DsrF family protein
MVLLILSLVFLADGTSMAHADENPDIAKVVYHADYADPQRMSSMLTSIFNMVTTYENEFMDYDIRIVFLSHGIQFLPMRDSKARLLRSMINRQSCVKT